jgi:hypothetical protein
LPSKQPLLACWTTTQLSPKEKRKSKEKMKKKRKKCRQRRIDENDDDPQSLRPSENSHHALSTLKLRVPSSTFKKDAMMATLLPGLVLRGFPRYAEGRGKRVHPMPFKKEWRRHGGARGRHRVGVVLPTRISPDPQKNHDPDAPSRSTKLVAHQLTPP